jgi:hypothetical protein
MDKVNNKLRSISFVYQNGKFQKVFPTSDGYVLEDGTKIAKEEGSTPFGSFCLNKAFSLRKSESYQLNSFEIEPHPELLEKMSGIKESKWEYLNDEEKSELKKILMENIAKIDVVFTKNQERLYHESEEFARMVTTRLN